ncbi:MAG: hypothetical protein ACTS27_07180 [Phycisphaerales bacterium]
MKRVRLGLGLVLVSAFLVGCGSTHHQVTDPSSGRTYYTNDLKRTRGGAVEFTDARSGSSVTMQNSEVKKIDKKTFREQTEDN